MPINNYTVRSGVMSRSNGTVVNEADGINDDGSRNMKLAGSNVIDAVETLTPRTSSWVNFDIAHASECVFEQMISIKHTLDATLWVTFTAVTPVGNVNLLATDYKLEANELLILVPENTEYQPSYASNKVWIKTLVDLRMPYMSFSLAMRPRTSATDSTAKAPTSGDLKIGVVKRY